jgi:hypothetical protein
MATCARVLGVSGLVAALCLGGAPSSSAAVVTFGSLSLNSTGPLGPTAPANLANAPGASAFAIDSLSGFAIHVTPHLNDGNYGNDFSWIGNSGRPIDVDGDAIADVSTGFGGIDLAGSGLFELTQIAWGRSNLANEFADRTQGTYYVQVTTLPNPNEATPDSAWTTVGGVTITTSSFGDTYRHLYDISGLPLATGVRIVVPGVGFDIVSGTAIDEIELYGTSPVPEPTTFATLLGGLAVLARRRASNRDAKRSKGSSR